MGRKLPGTKDTRAISKRWCKGISWGPRRQYGGRDLLAVLTCGHEIATDWTESELRAEILRVERRNDMAAPLACDRAPHEFLCPTCLDKADGVGAVDDSPKQGSMFGSKA